MGHDQVDDVDVTPEDVEARTPAESMEQEPFVQLTTPGAKMKIITALLRVHGEKLNMSGICERAGIHHDTWYEHRDDLLKFGVMEEAEPAGNSPMYRANREDPIVKRFVEIRGLAAQRAYDASHGE